MKTIGSVLDNYRGIGPGFDFLRVALALAIVFDHSFLIVEGNYDTVKTYHLGAIFDAFVPMFFALSGFLICGSAQRLKLKDFLINRALRIVPALLVDIVIAALVIGTCVTVLPLSDYFSDKKFAHYFLNIIGFIHYELPGVFTSNPFSGQINGSLWTVPFEIGCYAIMSILIITGAMKSKIRMLSAALIFILVHYGLHFYLSAHAELFASENALNNYFNNFVSDRGNFLYFDFIAGTLIYMFRYQLPYSGKLALVAMALVLFSGLKILALGMAKPLVLAFPIGYLIAYIGLQPIPKLPLYSRGDYSYGIYLYAYPLQQLLMWLFPGRFSILPYFICSILLVTGVVMLSWHGVEKPILSIRKKFSFTARKGDTVVALLSA